MRHAVVAAAFVALLVPGETVAGRFAVGVKPGASLADVAAAVERVAGAPVSVDRGLRAVFVSSASARGVRSLANVAYVERIDTKRRLAFVPNDPLFPRQWHLPQVRAFDAWPQMPALRIVRVAVLDSGIDSRHPEFTGRIAAAKSFIGGSPYRDKRGHGTFVAGEIAAETDNGQGVAGLAFSADLVVGKIARADGTIPIEAEARAIRWAVDKGARVINLSLAGVRDPMRRTRDSFSRLEASAIAYAHRHGAVVVAAVGNSDQTPRSPWNYAGYPAALPHVLGVSALAKGGSVPPFSNRDAVFNDIAAPGEDIFSTLPRAVTASRPNCPYQGYSDCGPAEFRNAEGTSFSAPLVSAAAALVLAVRPDLKPDQVTTLLERSATDLTPSTGCRPCSLFRDRFTGWGRLDVTTAVVGALAGAVPRADRFEPNDGAAGEAHKLFSRSGGRISAMIDYWDDPIDVYRVKLRRGERLTARLRGPGASDTNLMLWRPGTRELTRLAARGFRVAQSRRPGPVERIPLYRARTTGWHYLEVKISKPGSGGYSLTYSKSE